MKVKIVFLILCCYCFSSAFGYEDRARVNMGKFDTTKVAMILNDLLSPDSHTLTCDSFEFLPQGGLPKDLKEIIYDYYGYYKHQQYVGGPEDSLLPFQFADLESVIDGGEIVTLKLMRTIRAQRNGREYEMYLFHYFRNQRYIVIRIKEKRKTYTFLRYITMDEYRYILGANHTLCMDKLGRKGEFLLLFRKRKAFPIFI